MPALKNPFQVEQFSDHCIISVDSEFEDSRWNELNKIAEELLDEIGDNSSGAYLFDLSTLDYMSSEMLAVIVRLWKTIDRRKQRMVVVNSHAMVREVLRLSGLSKLWTIVSRREEGLTHLGIGGRKAPKIKGKSKGSLVVLGVSFLMSAVSAVGLYLRYFNLNFAESSDMLTGFAFGGAMLGFLCSVYLVAIGSGWKRKVAVLSGLCSVCLFTFALMKHEALEDDRSLVQNENVLIKSRSDGEIHTDSRNQKRTFSIFASDV